MSENFDLASLVIPHLNPDPATLEFTSIQTGKHNRSFWVNCNQGRFVLRIAPPDEAGFLFYERLMMHQEPHLHALIRAKTDLPVAEIVAYDFSRTIIDQDYVLMTALPGTPLSDAPGLTAAQFHRTLAQVGEYLRQLHTLTAVDCLARDEYGYLGEHHPMIPQPDWAAAFKLMWHKLLDDVVACGGYSPDEGQAMRDLLDIHEAHFHHSPPAVLLHMDVWSQNILIDEAGNVTGLVDFDRALWGDIEIEFAVLDYCGISEPAFWEGYGAPRDDSSSSQIRGLFYLLYELQKYMPIQVWRRHNLSRAMAYKQQSFSLATQLLPQN